MKNNSRQANNPAKFGRYAHLAVELPALYAYSGIYVAYSGGLDSHVLLHACADDPQIKHKITAVYINHGLLDEADAWGLHCEAVCRGLGVNFQSIKVNARAAKGESPEEAARNARYAALKPLLAEGDALLLAQHRDDQLETVLLQLFRGSGLAGLSGMPERMAFGKGLLLRPLLAVPKTRILDYAISHSLKWIEDPSNGQEKFDRNFLRNEVLPVLKRRWPALDLTVSRSASHCADAEALMASVAESLYAGCTDTQGRSLNLSALALHPTFQQQLVVRRWFKELGLKPPSVDVGKRILREVAFVRADAEPMLLVQDYAIRRYRNRLYAVKDQPCAEQAVIVWPRGETAMSIGQGGAYQILPSNQGIPVTVWEKARVTAQFRGGGESLRLPGRHGRHSLKKLYQEIAIPPWQRRLIPLIYLDDELAAVGDIWIDASYYHAGGVPCYRLAKVNNGESQ